MSKFETVEFYRQDVEALRALGHQVVLATAWWKIPLNFDLLFVWWWSHALVPILMAKLRAKPCIVCGTLNFRWDFSPENSEVVDYFHRPVYQRLVLALALKLATRNFIIGQRELEDCTKYFRITTGRYFPCVIGDEYMCGPGGTRELAMLSVSWFQTTNLKRKGIPDLLEAVRVTKEHGFDLHLYLVGHEGDGWDFVSALVKDLDIEDRVHLLGEVDRDTKIELLRRCEVYVQPSYYEGFGLAIAEAMACGACVITCDVGAVKEVVGDTALFVRPGAPEELARTIEKAVSEPVLRSRLQAAAYARAKAAFSSERKRQMVAKYLEELGIR